MAANLPSSVYLIHLKSVNGNGYGYLSITNRESSELFNSSNLIAKGRSTTKPYANETPDIWFALYGSGTITLTHADYSNLWTGEVYKMSLPNN